MIASAIPPGLILILGAVPAILLRGRARQVWMLLLPALSLCNMLALPEGITSSCRSFARNWCSPASTG